MSGLRVIGGEARGRRLKMVPGEGTRPISDRVKESLFNILGPAIDGGSFLDLFAGTGGVGIEALSRGGRQAWFVENRSKAIKTIHQNLELTGLADRARVIRADVYAFLQETQPEGFDYVYVAPPQYRGLWASCLRALDATPDWVNPDGSVVAQIDPHEYERIDLSSLVEVDLRTYGNTRLVFYERPGW